MDAAKFRGLTTKSIGDVGGNVDLPSKQSGLNQFLVGKLAGRNRISPTNLGSSSRKLLSEQKKYRDVRYAQTWNCSPTKKVFNAYQTLVFCCCLTMLNQQMQISSQTNARYHPNYRKKMQAIVYMVLWQRALFAIIDGHWVRVKLPKLSQGLGPREC